MVIHDDDLRGTMTFSESSRTSQVDVAVNQAQRGAVWANNHGRNGQILFRPRNFGWFWWFCRRRLAQIWADLTGHRVGSSWGIPSPCWGALKAFGRGPKAFNVDVPEDLGSCMVTTNNLTGRPSSFYYVWICLDGLRASKYPKNWEYVRMIDKKSSSISIIR
jgi:hypothetical protein